MHAYVRHPLTYTWMLLALATVTSWMLGLEQHVQNARPSAWVVGSILLVALFKCRVVMRNYMEVRHSPGWLRWACDAWLLLNLVMITAFYWPAAT